jgi:hypothetical protein
LNDSLAQRRLVDKALSRVRSNSWEVVFPRPVLGAIGFALERPLYDFLVNPEQSEVPRGAAALCVFHKNYKPAGSNKLLWQIANENFDAYADADRNTLLRHAEDKVLGTPRILYARGMEYGCLALLDTLGYEVSKLGSSGRKQSGIDLVGVLSDPEEENDDQVVAVECKTTTQGFAKKSLRVLFNSIFASLKKSRDTDVVRSLHPVIDQHGGVFDYLVAANREFKSPELRPREGYFILRGIEVG